MSRSLRLELLALLLLALAVGGWFAYQEFARPKSQPGGPGGPNAGKPAARLVVLVVFDQMRGDYLDRWAEGFGPDGFERIKKEGVWYGDCHLPYACSSTAPGHASIATGTPPSVHGIVENGWYQREGPDRGLAYCVQPKRPYDMVPAVPASAGKSSRGAENGFSPERLLAETVGDRLHAATSGKGRVVSLSIKDRTAVLMGGKTPDAVYCFDTRDGKFHTTTFYRDRPHAWVEEFNASPGVNAWLGKKWERFRTDLDYDRLAGPDAALGESYGYFGQGRVFPHPFAPKSTAPDRDYFTTVETSPAGNELLLELAKKAVVAEKLGAGDTPDLLCVSFSSNDLIGHQWGPDSWEVLDVTLRSDRLVADFLKFLDGAVGPQQYVMLITADHGACPMPEQKRLPGAARVPLGAVLNPLHDALEETFGRDPAGPTRWLDVPEAAGDLWPWLHLNHSAIAARGLEPAAVADYAAQWLGNRPYMLTAFTRKQIETNALPPVPPAGEKEVRAAFEKAKLAYHPQRCGDVIAIPRPGVQVTTYEVGTSHGSPHEYDTHVPVLVYGAGVPALGRRAERVSSLIVAPILARSLGIDPPSGAVEKVPEELKK